MRKSSSFGIAVIALSAFAVLVYVRLIAPGLDDPSEQVKPRVAREVNGQGTRTLDAVPEQWAAATQSSDTSDGRAFECDAFDENSEINQELSEKNLDARARNLKRISQTLLASHDAEHLLMAALTGFESGSKERLDVLTSAYQADAGQRLVTWNLLDECVTRPEASWCDNQSLEKLAIEADGGNGQLWAKIAGNRFKRGETAAAFTALRMANTAPQFTAYLIEHMELFERGLAAATEYSYQERIVQAMGITAAMVSGTPAVLRGCREHAESSVERWSLCLDFGRRIEKQGRTALSKLLGIGLQKQMHEMSGNVESVAELVQRAERIRKRFLSAQFADSQVLLERDPTALMNYINEWAAHGELGAMDFLDREVVRLKELPDYDPCRL